MAPDSICPLSDTTHRGYHLTAEGLRLPGREATRLTQQLVTARARNPEAHSSRNSTTGFARTAARVGGHDAAAIVSASTPVTTAQLSGSVGLTS